MIRIFKYHDMCSLIRQQNTCIKNKRKHSIILLIYYEYPVQCGAFKLVENQKVPGTLLL